MIRSAVVIHETVQYPFPPDFRRSSRNPVREAAYQEHEDIKKYYKSRTVNIESVYKIYKNIKYLTKRASLIKRVMVEKYGESFGSLLAKKITEEYLTIPSFQKSDIYYMDFYYKCELYVKSGSVPKPYQSPNPFIWHSKDRQLSNHKRLKSLRICVDPRCIKYSAIELVSYLKRGYDIMVEGTEYILLASRVD